MEVYTLDCKGLFRSSSFLFGPRGCGKSAWVRRVFPDAIFFLKFVLTGSSARKLRRGGANLLAGRAHTRRMHPLTAIELGKDYKLGHSLRFGQLPLAYTQKDPAAYLRSYAGTYLREEVMQEGLTRNLGAFARFLEQSSLGQGQVLNTAALARDASVTEDSRGLH